MKFLFLLLTPLLLWGCNKTEKTSSPFVVTSFYPLYVMTQNVMQATPLKVENMAEPVGQHLHDYQLKPVDLKKLEEAKALIVNGYGLESFLDRVTKLYPKLPIINASTFIDRELMLYNEEEEDHNDHNHLDEEVNGHFWLNPALAILQVEAIAEALAQVDEENAEQFIKNALQYKTQLEELLQEMQSELESYVGQKIILFHEGLGYWVQDFNFETLALFQHNEESGLKPTDIMTLTQLVQQNPKVVLLADNHYPSRLLNLISKQTGKTPVLLDLALNGDGGLQSYQTTMRHNLVLLKQALALNE